LLFAENPVTAKAVGAGLRARPPSPPTALPSLIISVGTGGEIMRAAFLRRPTMQSSASRISLPAERVEWEKTGFGQVFARHADNAYRMLSVRG